MQELGDRGISEEAYLAGGNGLAPHFGHRVCVDLDFFLDQDFNEEGKLQRIRSLRF